jgi:hypothetical protein
MEHLDPTESGGDWERLSDREREFYCLCVEAILDERYLIEEALGVRGAPATTYVKLPWEAK